MRSTSKYLYTLLVLLFITITQAFAGTEPYENFIKGSIKKNDSVFVKDEKFKNPAFNWAEITNIKVDNAITLKVVDDQPINTSFKLKMTLRVEYFSDPAQVKPTKIDAIELNVNYVKGGISAHKLNDTYPFTNGYYVKVYVTGIESPELGEKLPAIFQLTNSIVIERRYQFKPFLKMGLNGNIVSGGQVQKNSGFAQFNTGSGTTNNNHQLALSWPIIAGAEYDVEWTAIDGDGQWKTLADSIRNVGINPIIPDLRLAALFRDNATRITTDAHEYLISLMFNADLLVVRMRQVQYDSNGIRLEGDWDYRLNNPSNSVAFWDLTWHQSNLNWQYSSAYAEEGKKKEVVSYFDGTLRGRQTVTLNNESNVAVVQENIYDEFGRAAASILPAPVKVNSGATPEYLHYFSNFNQNSIGQPYSFNDLNALNCEPLPQPLSLNSGAARYYSGNNQFINDKTYNKYIPSAAGYPLSVTQYTADNTGRIKLQGGVGLTFQPGTSESRTTKYYYGKPEQYELDKIFGNDVGYASHYLKNMVIDPNGQISLSYLNAGGKTVATALAGSAPTNLDPLSSLPIVKTDTIPLFKPAQFTFSASELKLTATTTYLVSVPDTAAVLTYDIENLVSCYPDNAWKPCYNCYYELTVTVKDDCQQVVYQNKGNIKLGSKTSQCVVSPNLKQDLKVNFAKVGEYYITYDFELSKPLIDSLTESYVDSGQVVGHLKKKSQFIKAYLTNAIFADCYADCKVARKKLGTQAAFTNMFNAKLTDLGEDASLYTADIAGIYTDLLAKITVLEQNCGTSLCDFARQPMLADVSPGGQFAKFDEYGNALEPGFNIIALNFKNGVFNSLNSSDQLYQDNLVTLANGEISSPYDANFTIKDLILYWQPSWAEKFLPQHPEICKLEFCEQNTLSNKFDELLKNTADPNALAGITTPSAAYSTSNAIWLLNSDPFFKPEGKGSAYINEIKDDLQQYSTRRLKVNQVSSSAVAKNLSQYVDYQLYCKDDQWTTNSTSSYGNTWNYCLPKNECRVQTREWELYRELYLELKDVYIDKARKITTCSGVCEIGTAVTASPYAPPAPACNTTFPLPGDVGVRTAFNQFTSTNYASGSQSTHYFIEGNANITPDNTPYCTLGTIQKQFYPCVKVYIPGNSTPVNFTNVWRISCTQQVEVCGITRVIYAQGVSGSNYVSVSGNQTTTYVITPGTPGSQPPVYCSGTIYYEPEFYQCIRVNINGVVTTRYNSWLYICVTTTGGGSTGGGGENCDPPVPVYMRSALQANIAPVQNNLYPPTCEIYNHLQSSKSRDEDFLADYYSRTIYSVKTERPDEQGTSTGVKPLFSAYEFKPYFAVRTDSAGFDIRKNIWVASYLSDPASAKVKQERIVDSLLQKPAPQTAQKGNVAFQTLGFTSVCVTYSDQLFSTSQGGCGASSYTNSYNRTTIVLRDASGNAVRATSPVTVYVKYYVIENGGGINYAPVPIVIPAGQSSAYYQYAHQYNGILGNGSCGYSSMYLDCIQSISGAGFCESVYSCSGGVLGGSLQCPPGLASKTSHFGKVSLPPSTVTADTAAFNANYREQLKKIIYTNCQANADGWIEKLQPGLTAGSYTPSQIATLKAKLAELCEKGGDSSRLMGASTAPMAVVVNVGGTNVNCTSFGAIIKNVLGLNSFTNLLNPWILDAPYPYDVPHLKTEVVVSNSDNSICSKLLALNGGAHPSNISTFYNSLVSRFGAAMTLTEAELGMVAKSCNNCKFILEKDIKLPVFLMGNNQCVTKTTVVADTTAVYAEFSGLTPASANYNTIVATYLNHKYGFSFTYDRYHEFANSSNTQLCNELPYTTTDGDDYGCVKSLIEQAVGNGLRDYQTYITEEKEKFRNAYIGTCAAAKASATLSTKQQTYHYTLYYYDLAGNLVRTVPPEGVNFLTAKEMVQVEKARDMYAADCNYNGPTADATEATALQSLSNTIASTGNSAVELWVYSNSSQGRQFIAATPDMKYMMQACINGNLLNIDIFTLNQTAPDNVAIILSNHVTANITALNPLFPWTHLVVQGANLASGNLQLWVNGVQYPAVSGAPSAGCGWEITNNPLTMPKNLTAIKHLRLYNRLMSGSEIAYNANSGCLEAQNNPSPLWYRFNTPAVPGGPTAIADNTTNETQYNGVYPLHNLPTTYAYNSTNQVIQQQTPDAGTSKFWYDELSRLAVSQNAKQQANNNYSYTSYDVLGRITEVGQKNTSYNLGNPNYLTTAQLSGFAGSGSNSQLTQTFYDTAPVAGNGIPGGLNLNHLRKRVSGSIYRESPGSANINASYYSYDLGGNVKTLYQQVDGLGIKKLDYEYDLISGKVNFLAYQHGENDRFYYQYEYDAENKLTDVWTAVQASIAPSGFGSRLNDPYRKLEAQYQYYLHGPLARMELGDQARKVQGTDYAYTLQGWLKGVNGTQLNTTKDIGQDGTNNIAKDALAYSLGYYNNDYTAIGGGTAFTQTYTANNGDISGRALYNGNISNSTYAIIGINNNSTTGYSYNYDQLNRLKNSWQHDIGTSSWNIATKTDNYKETFSYDGNGNILELQRNKQAAANMDNLSYAYQRDANSKLINNRLQSVSDAAGSSETGELIGTSNYTYDPIGNLIADSKEGITNIDWNVYGKIKSINKTNPISYTYDATGNRASKLYNGKTTWYVRDAQGNQLATYDNIENTLKWKEQLLYGSSRLGMWKPDFNLAVDSGQLVYALYGKKFFEGNNHVGNAMFVINDNRIVNGSTFEPVVINAQDYYAFGSQMPGRQAGTGYKYGFNGKENDNEVAGEGNQQDYGMRIYDPRLGRFKSVDPLTKKYPNLTPYQFASNTPIQAIDQDGLEAFFVTGTTATNKRWFHPNTDGGPVDFTLINGLMQMTRNTAGDASFNWNRKVGGHSLNRLTNNEGDRKIAASDLMAHVMSYRKVHGIDEYNDKGQLVKMGSEPITLIGHSHGGNVSIQAANMIYDKYGVQSDIIAIATPAYTKKEDAENPANARGVRRLLNIWNKIDKVSGQIAPGSKDYYPVGPNSKVSRIEVDASPFYKSYEGLDAHSFDNNHMADFIRQVKQNSSSEDLKKKP